MPTLQDLALLSDDVDYWCYAHNCRHSFNLPVSELIREHGRDYDFMRLRAKYRCVACGSENTTVTASPVYSGPAYEKSESGAIARAESLEAINEPAALEKARARVRSFLAAGAVQDAVFWSTVRGVLLARKQAKDRGK